MKNQKLSFENLLAQAGRMTWQEEDEEGDLIAQNEEWDGTLGELRCVDDLDAEILMHRDAHFSGNFQLMLDYYQSQGKGSYQEFSLERIHELAAYEEEQGENLAALLLTGSHAEKVGRARDAYRSLKELYERDADSEVPVLVADLLLSETDKPVAEMASLMDRGTEAVSPLIALLRADAFYDPLFPGYGQAPGLAAECLGKIGDERAVIPLFEALGKGDFFIEEQVLKALQDLGAPAKAFLVKVLQSRPLTADNEKAAMTLCRFEKDPHIGDICLQQMKCHENHDNAFLMSYLALGCEGLQQPHLRHQFKELLNTALLPRMVREEMKGVLQQWTTSQSVGSLT